MRKTQEAVDSLIRLIELGMEFPDATARVSKAYNLTDAQLRQVKRVYDTLIPSVIRNDASRNWNQDNDSQ